MMNDKKQSKNLLSRLREDKRSVLYVNETTRNTLAKKKKKIYIPKNIIHLFPST